MSDVNEFAVSVTMTVTEWNQVLAQLSTGQFSVVYPLITSIKTQAEGAIRDYVPVTTEHDPEVPQP